VESLTTEIADLDSPLPLTPETTKALAPSVLSRVEKGKAAITASGRALHAAFKGATADAGSLLSALRQLRQDTSVAVTKAVVQAGGTKEELAAFDKNKAKAARFERLKVETDQARKKLSAAEQRLTEKIAERHALIASHRQDLEALVQAVNAKFLGTIRLSLVAEGDHQPLEEWIRSLRQAGVSRWWNDRRSEEDHPRVSDLRAAASGGRLGDLGMSAAVSESFRSSLTQSGQVTLGAIRCPDALHLEARVADDPPVYRKLGELSGGKRISVLLALLLSSEDVRPLVIDQPEDELDGQFLINELLPMLRRLKGRRQIIFATHNANIVVNGDADCVICLDATHDEGCVSASGAIESPEVKHTIVNTVDGGRAAFELRATKYGY
jgi:hypothetical protein